MIQTAILHHQILVTTRMTSKKRLRARFRRARKPHFFQYVCTMTYYIQAHHATSLHNLPKPHVWQCVCVMQFSINIIMELAYATLQHCITHVSSTFFTLSPCYMKYRWIMLKGEGGGGHQRVLRKSWMGGGGGGVVECLVNAPSKTHDSPTPPPPLPPPFELKTLHPPPPPPPSPPTLKSKLC